MKVGVAVLTYNRPKHRSLFFEQHWNNTHGGLPTKMDITTGVCTHENGDQYYFKEADDSINRKGVAYRTNECLYALKDCDHIFIFNDDCFPIKKGWEKVYIESGMNHLLYFRETIDIEKMQTVNGVDYFSNCGGCLIYITKEVIEKVGYLNKDYLNYGYEHAGYSLRINKSGLTPHPYMVPSNAGEYIYSLDYDNYLDFGIEHHSSMEINEVEGQLNHNKKIFMEDIKEIYQPYAHTI